MARLVKPQPTKDFDLPDSNGNSNAIRDLCGRWVVVYFYPEGEDDKTAEESRDFSERIRDFAQLGADVLGISTIDQDASRAFREEHGIRFPLLTDADHQVMTDYGAWGGTAADGSPIEGAVRSTILIDPDGLVERAWYEVSVPGHAQEVLEVLTSRS